MVAFLALDQLAFTLAARSRAGRTHVNDACSDSNMSGISACVISYCVTLRRVCEVREMASFHIHVSAIVAASAGEGNAGA